MNTFENQKKLNDELNHFFNSAKDKKFDEMTKKSLEFFYGRIKTTKTIKEIALKHLVYIYKSKNDDNFPFKYEIKLVNKFEKLSKSLYESKGIEFDFYRKFMFGFLIGWVNKNNPKKLMIRKILDLDTDEKEKSYFWSLFMIFYTSEFFIKKGSKSIVFEQKENSNNQFISKIINNILTLDNLKNNFIRHDEQFILTKNMNEIKKEDFYDFEFEKYTEHFVYFNEFYKFENDINFLKIDDISSNNNVVVFDGKLNQNIETSCFYLFQKLSKNFSENLKLDETNIQNTELLIWNPKNDKQPELFVKDNEKSYLYYSLFSSSNETVEPIVNKYIQQNFCGKFSILSIDFDLMNKISICLMFLVDDNKTKNYYIFRTYTIVSKNYLDKKELVMKPIYNKWIKESKIIVLGEDFIDINLLMRFIKILLQKHKIKKIVYKGFDLTAKSFVTNYLIKYNIIDQKKLMSVETKKEIWSYFQFFLAKIYNKQLYFVNEDFDFKQFLNFYIEEKNQEWNIKQISNDFLWGSVFSTLLCIGFADFLKDVDYSVLLSPDINQKINNKRI